MEFLKNHPAKDTLPQSIIPEGNEGPGKSPFAKILVLEIMGRDPQVPQRVINESKSTESVLLYNVSISRGKDTAKEVETNLNFGLSGLDKKVIILGEAYDMSDVAQEASLVSTEYFPKSVCLFMYTIDFLNLKATLRSRIFTLHPQYPTQVEMISLLTSYVRDRNLRVQAKASAIQIIAAWTDGKPCIVLNLTKGFVPGSAVSTAMVKELIDYLGVEDILPLLTCLSGSMTQGPSVISEMKVNSSLVLLMVEILKVESGMVPFKLSLSDTHKVRVQLNDVDVDTLTQFIYHMTALPKLPRTGPISVFLQSHTGSSFLSLPLGRTEVFQAEMQQKMEVPKQGLAGAVRP